MNTPATFLAIFLIFFLLVTPRQFIFAPFVIAACFLPVNQRIIFFTLDFTVLRLLILFGIFRLLMRGETRRFQWNKFDKLTLSWVMVGSFVYIIHHADFGSVVYKSGVIFDSLGMYWLSRQVLRSWDDVFELIKIFGFLAIITAPLIALGTLTESSVFSVFGGTGGMFHRGRFRALGSFPHSIMLGCFWASLLPFFYSRIKTLEKNMFYWLALLSGLSNIFFSASSTPLLTVAAIILFWNFYNYRMHGAMLFKASCLGLLVLHLIMKAPVWHLMARIDIFSGSTGWHRFHLFDQFIRNISDWFFFGTEHTERWGAGLNDITNQFVLEGVRGGFVTLLIFIWLQYLAVKVPGKLSLGIVSPEVRWICWGICVNMLGHFVTFWGVSYFGQINMLLYISFALVGFTLEKSIAADSSLLTFPR